MRYQTDFRHPGIRHQRGGGTLRHPCRHSCLVSRRRSAEQRPLIGRPACRGDRFYCRHFGSRLWRHRPSGVRPPLACQPLCTCQLHPGRPPFGCAPLHQRNRYSQFVDAPPGSTGSHLSADERRGIQGAYRLRRTEYSALWQRRRTNALQRGARMLCSRTQFHPAHPCTSAPGGARRYRLLIHVRYRDHAADGA